LTKNKSRNLYENPFNAYSFLILGMGNKSKIFALILILIMALSSLTLLMVKPASAQEIPQGPPTSDEWAPFITFKMADGTLVEDNFSQQAIQPLNLNLTAFANNSPEGREYGVLSVSYVASWLNTPVVLYSWSGNPANLNDWFTNNSNTNPNSSTHLGWIYYSQTPNGTEIYGTGGPPYWVDYNLVLNDIPLGHQQINFTIVKAALYWGGEFGYAEMASNETVNFTVTNSPSSTPAVSEFPASIILPLLAAALISIVFSRKRITEE
jgi:hypothetical protein